MSTRPATWLSVLRLCRIGTWLSPAADVLAGAAITGVAFGPEVLGLHIESRKEAHVDLIWRVPLRMPLSALLGDAVTLRVFTEEGMLMIYLRLIVCIQILKIHQYPRCPRCRGIDIQ